MQMASEIIYFCFMVRLRILYLALWCGFAFDCVSLKLHTLVMQMASCETSVPDQDSRDDPERKGGEGLSCIRDFVLVQVAIKRLEIVYVKSIITPYRHMHVIFLLGLALLTTQLQEGEEK